MGETTRDEALAADPNEAAFQRLAEGLAALRRDTERLREPAAGAPGPSIDPKGIAESLAEIHRRIDAVTSRVNAVGDSGPVLAALAAVEEKIGALTAGLDRFAEQNTVTEALAKANSKIDTLAARIDARLNRLQDNQAGQGARVGLGTRPDPAASAIAAEPARRRSHLPALLLLAAMVISAVGVLAWMRPDLIKPDWVRHEWVEPAHDAVARWLRLSQAATGHPATQAAAVPASAASAQEVSAPIGGLGGEAGAKAELPPAAGETALPRLPHDGPGAGVQVAGTGAFVPTAQAASFVQPSAPEQLPPAEAATTASAAPASEELATTASLPADPVPADEAAVAEPPASPPAPSRGKTPRVVLGAKADAWLMVRDEGGRTLLARILHEGETWAVPDLPGLRLSTGNAGATLVMIDGVAIPTLGESGAVRHDLLLDGGGLAIDAPPAHATHGRSHSAGARPVNPDRADVLP